MHNTASSPGGPLQGQTILRFAHAFESGGGTERYLDDLDGALLERNAATIVRLYLTRESLSQPWTETRIGQGILIRWRVPAMPSAVRTGDHRTGGKTSGRIKQWLRDHILYHPLIWRAAGARWTSSRRLRLEPGQGIGVGKAVQEVLHSHPVGLVMMHFFGGADADEIFPLARAARIPLALLNHYSNDRFLNVAIRKHAMLANAVAGVNGLEVPGYLRAGFTNLSDGIDTDFFSRAHTRPPPKAPSFPVILLPARLVPEKGQMDLIRSVAELRKSGTDCGIVFAGRADGSEYVDELRREMAQCGLTECGLFLGDLPLKELRDWYAAATVVAFPTYHHEGLGRAVVEAQSLGVPVVAYATGGVPEALVPEKSGFLVPTGDVASLTRRLGQLLHSASLRDAMGAEGRRLAEGRFSLASLAARHEEFYLRVMGGAWQTAPLEAR